MGGLGSGVVGEAFAPDDLAGLSVWLRASSLALSDGDAVTTWENEGAQGDATQATAGLKPVYKTNIINGLPVVRFDGTGRHLAIAAFVNSASWTVFWVAKTTVNSVQQVFTADYSAGARYGQTRFQSNASVRLIGFNTTPSAFSDDQPFTAGSFVYASFVRRSSTIQAYVNGTSGGSTAISGTAPTSNRAWHVGRVDPADAINTELLNGDVAEILLYASALSDVDRARVESYLSAKYAL
jgi:hypothetical protein